ncbi:MAG: LysR family transcriptional regulator [Firmicutes bacterium]|nr:LysR family transcriptional regulator [Bacillota bacterium]
MYIKTRITIRNEEHSAGHGFGRGIELLLTGIEQHGSLNRAAKELGMAYSKAWRIIRQAEEELGVQLIDRDGAHGSTQTEDGATFLARYREMLAAADAAANMVFHKYYS